MNRLGIIFIFVGFIPFIYLATDEPKVPAIVKELFTDFDLCQVPRPPRFWSVWRY